MGAFDGLVFNYSSDSDRDTEYVPCQPSFNFTKSFTREDLSKLLKIALECNKDTIWVPSMRTGGGKIGLSTWYVKALLETCNI